MSSHNTSRIAYTRSQIKGALEKDLNDHDESLTENLSKWLTQPHKPSEIKHIHSVAEELLESIEVQKNEYQTKVEKLISQNKFTHKKIEALLSENSNVRLSAGYDDEYAQFDEIIASMLLGVRDIEIQTLGPYAAIHKNKDTGEIYFDEKTMTPDERTGLLLSSEIKKLSKIARTNIRIVSLLDEYNDYVDPQMDFEITQRDRYQYVAFIAQLFIKLGIITPDEKPGLDYVILLESEQVKKIPKLIESLKKTLKGEVRSYPKDGHTIISFFPSDDLVKLLRLPKERRKEFRKTGIVLTIDDKPTCQALDAATFIADHNAGYLHFVMLDSHFSSQQDKVFTLLRALDITTNHNYHNVYFDSNKLPPEVTVYVFLAHLHTKVANVLSRLKAME